jgi:hypothetical protein
MGPGLAPAKKLRKCAFLAAVVGHVGSRHRGSTQTGGDGATAGRPRGEASGRREVVAGGVADGAADAGVVGFFDGGGGVDDEDDECGRFSDDGGLTLKLMGDADLWLWCDDVDDDDSGRSVDDRGDSLDEVDVILCSPWLFMRSVSILLHARVSIASGSHFSSY